MSDNGLNVFYTFCFYSNIHHPGLGHRELWNINPFALFSAKEFIKLRFSIVAYMNNVYNTHMKVIYVMAVKKSSWTPIANRDKFLDSYISTITSDIMNAPEHKSYGNLSFEERSALKDLKSNVNLVIREADKGSSVVVMDRQRYIEEGYRQLNDTSVYLRTRATAISDI